MAFGTLVRRDPFFPFHRALGTVPADPGPRFSPHVDAVEEEDLFRVTAELPGLDASDFHVEIEDGVLTLEGEKRNRLEGDDEESGRPSYRRVETRWGHFARRLRFGVEVDEDAISARFENGVLEIVVPKAPESSRARTIPVTTA